MQRQPSLLTASRFDVLVVGAGIHGLAVAYDAASRGLSVAVVDRGDFGSGSSFNHAKTVHGGLRSLQTGDLLKARFSVVERRAMARVAPQLVVPLPFMFATTRKLTRSKLALGVGFAIDALVGFDRHAGVSEPLRLPAGRVVGLDEYRRTFGACAQAAATGGARWFDYQMPEAERLTLGFAEAACQAGAVLATYVEATDPLVSGSRVRGIAAHDVETGDRMEIAARLTVNTTGGFSGAWARKLGGPLDFPLVKAMNVVTSRPAGPVALGAPTADGRLLLLMPWKGLAMIGTSHSEQPVDPGSTGVTPAEVEAFLAEANEAFPGLALTMSDVRLVHRGVVPGERDRRGRLGLRGHHLVHDHARDGIEGAISVIGVKYTTARGVAEQTVDLAQAKLGCALSPCRTGTSRLPAWAFDSPAAELSVVEAECGALIGTDAARGLVATHGTSWRAIADLCRVDPSLAMPIPSSIIPKATVLHAIRSEMARTLTDVVARRIGLGAAGYPGDDAVAECARLAAAELGWDKHRVEHEIAALRSFYAPVDVQG